MLSLIQNKSIEYPSPTDYFSPDVPYPEYRYPSVSKYPNGVYEAVRTVFAQCGLDSENFGTSSWNPLGRFIRPGSRVFILCNFVYHRRPNESEENFSAKCTHASVLRAVLDYAILAVGPDGFVTFGNAPVQSCDWERILRDTGASRIVEFYQRQGVRNVATKDLRSYVCQWDWLGHVTRVEQRNIGADAVTIDLGSQSLLSDMSASLFRVEDYSPARTVSCHQAGQHLYSIHRAVLDADVIISVPKLKVHAKVGITCGLKGCVGAIANKDCLAHYRFGASADGGDQYQGKSRIRTLLARFHDYVYTHDAYRTKKSALRIIDRNVRRIISFIDNSQAGGWYGNDTAWRMALDIARILIYASKEGALLSTPQRQHLVLVDGIVGGEGDGPLAPSAVHSGLLIFSDDVPLGDWVSALLMGFDPRKIALTREACNSGTLSGSNVQQGVSSVFFNGIKTDLDDVLSRSTCVFVPPKGWKGHIERVLAERNRSVSETASLKKILPS